MPDHRQINSSTRHHEVVFALVFSLVAMSSLLACARPVLTVQKVAAIDSYRIVNTYPHDPNAYTQGLIYLNGFLFESTGRNGQSTLRKVKLQTGQVLQQHSLDRAYFAEGLTEWDDQLVQLTWVSNTAFVYDLDSFALRRTFHYSGEGWGLTHDQQGFILSDGTENLHFLDPNTFRETRALVVTDGGIPVKGLNELEYVRGEVYANVRHTDRIARISPQSGRVNGWIDLKGLMPTVYQLDPMAELNGIAYDSVNNRLFVTGKLWPRLFEIEVVPRK